MTATTKLCARIIFPFAVLLLVLSGSAWANEKKPNILVVWGDDVGESNISAYTHGWSAIRPPISTALPMRA